ncbi:MULTISPECIES: SPASM domain-containing protein [Thiorhodovibrio]|uniref:SPASM domain-containing protein n=1 Tax=Thiorhodovibrio TaxID=61593 RepID=UPI00389B1D40
MAMALLQYLVSGRKRQVACGVGRGIAGISVSGELYPCHRFVGLTETRLGHLDDYRAGELNDYHRAVVDNLPVCRGCWARYLCGGGCFYDNQARTGDPHRPDAHFCQEIKTVCEDLIHGWSYLPDADRDYLREQIETLSSAERT